MSSREWEVQGAPPKKGRERNAERRAVNKPRRISRIAGRQRHTATPLGAPRRRLLRPWGRTSGTGASKLAIQAGFRPPFTCPVQPLKAEPRSGPGRLPKAPRVRRGTSPPRPQAPHPGPRYEASQATPLPWDRMPRVISYDPEYCQGGNIKFSPAIVREEAHW